MEMRSSLEVCRSSRGPAGVYVWAYDKWLCHSCLHWQTYHNRQLEVASRQNPTAFGSELSNYLKYRDMTSMSRASERQNLWPDFLLWRLPASRIDTSVSVSFSLYAYEISYIRVNSHVKRKPPTLPKTYPHHYIVEHAAALTRKGEVFISVRNICCKLRYGDKDT